MKKKLLILFVISCTFVPSLAIAGNGDPVPFTVKPTDPSTERDPFAKSPIHVPCVYLDGRTLSFDAAIEGCTVQLLQDDVVIFSHFIDENETSLTFPDDLSGTFELQIVRGAFTFYCYIEL